MVYEFEKEDAFRFANHVGAKAKTKRDELEFSICPYCHGGRKKDKNTFSINLNTGQFECKRSSCSVKGNMITLSRDFNFSISDTLDRFYNRNDYNDRFKKFKEAHIEVKDKAIDYLQKRGVSPEVTKRYQITTRKDNENILVFPFFSENQELKFIKYRKMDFDPEKDKSKEWCEADCMPILFGMDQCEDFTDLVITEGQIDSLSVTESGIKNAVSVPTGKNGFTWIPHCWEWFKKFQTLTIFGDNEKGKITLVDELAKRFPHKVKIVREEDYKGCKDANELLQNFGKDAVKYAITNARQKEIRQVKDLSEVEAVDIYNMPKIKFGMKTLDRLLGGMYLGQVLLLTGKRGDGKSTFMSQLICNATQQGYKTFVYSGELNDYYFKRWIDMQLAGDGYVTAQISPVGTETYHLRQSCIDKMNGWYRGKIKLYDNNIIEDEEMDNLLDVTEKVIQQHGVQFICIDNLMSALEVDPREDLYRAQSRFVGKLVKMAKLYNVVILLVAHPRKTSDNIQNDDVSGSADITNKVDVVMSYSKIEKEVDPNVRAFHVTKNRLTGKITPKDKGLELYYSPASKRVMDNTDDFTMDYGWVELDNGFLPVEEDIKLPFD